MELVEIAEPSKYLSAFVPSTKKSLSSRTAVQIVLLVLIAGLGLSVVSAPVREVAYLKLPSTILNQYLVPASVQVPISSTASADASSASNITSWPGRFFTTPPES